MSRSPQRTVLEYAVFVMSLLVVGGSAAYLIYTGLTGPPGAAVIRPEIQWDQAESSGGRYNLPLLIHNEGGRTITDLQIEIRQEAEAGPFEAVFSLPLLPHGSSRQLVVALPAPPLPDEVSVVVLGYRVE